jgi:hypothetical protein
VIARQGDEEQARQVRPDQPLEAIGCRQVALVESRAMGHQ